MVGNGLGICTQLEVYARCPGMFLHILENFGVDDKPASSVRVRPYRDEMPEWIVIPSRRHARNDNTPGGSGGQRAVTSPHSERRT